MLFRSGFNKISISIQDFEMVSREMLGLGFSRIPGKEVNEKEAKQWREFFASCSWKPSSKRSLLCREL